MLTKLRRFVPLCTMLVFPLLGAIYAAVDKPDNQVYSLVTDLDRLIPFVKYFVVPYSIWIFYIYACLVYFFLKDPRVYFRSLVTYTICALLCYAIYAVFQTTVPRPYLIGDDIFTKLMAYVYGRDLPFNCFPSIHCFSSYMVMKALNTSSFKNRLNLLVINGMSVLIIISTLMVKQHVILDVLAGILLVEFVYRFVVRMENVGKPLYGKAQSQRF